MACGEELENAMAADKSGSAGYQYCAHRRSLAFEPAEARSASSKFFHEMDREGSGCASSSMRAPSPGAGRAVLSRGERDKESSNGRWFSGWRLPLLRGRVPALPARPGSLDRRSLDLRIDRRLLSPAELRLLRPPFRVIRRRLPGPS